MDVLSLIAGVFLVAYGLGVVGWPYDVTRGVSFLERRSRRIRAIIGVMIIAAGILLAVLSLITVAF